MAGSPPIGVLALQGNVQAHARMLTQLGRAARPVFRPADLDGLAGLILPGGESTTLSQLLQHASLDRAIACFAQRHPLLGTCAGLILMCTHTNDARVSPLRLLTAEVDRNHYGRQRESFIASLEGGQFSGMRAAFIRAPAIHARAPLEVLATHAGRPVAVRQGRHVGCAFHPELGRDARVHEYWLRLA
ncbi:pyridoxal 5'-phosphate synthase glutaminase subunit PdxT [Thiohalobacter sp. COW1]|uniref:pyridoxal 5'-phosphate synthase glutaminase subunit PdxT n=1 Tax=Thiohalobacter sp. COW1 TaxID=2795687 RepID=UPI0019157BFC|nr:pyridoxal 5'-phosphate synthase glutaminase subunit PdxT [Thiohalobacter sp. COW1]